MHESNLRLLRILIMKRFWIANLFLLMSAAAIAPAAMAQGPSHSSATDRNGDGVISIQEVRLHYLDYSTN
ncbi:hypothetical protein BH23CYA1_BH23CYA1_03280 [soil metagenome]